MLYGKYAREKVDNKETIQNKIRQNITKLSSFFFWVLVIHKIAISESNKKVIRVPMLLPLVESNIVAMKVAKTKTMFLFFAILLTDICFVPLFLKKNGFSFC